MVWPPPSEPPAAAYVASPPLPDRVTGLTLIAVGASPFATALLMRAVGLDGNLPSGCIVQRLTGLPCPVCGATRAFLHASAGDPGFLHYNGFWVLVALGLILAGLAVIATRASLKGFWSRWNRLPVYLVVGLLASGWVWAFVNRATIVTT
ncbi:MAG: hypothetical protein BGO23_09040 [Solirubrobacterales bacterium 67-14]|nr:MAG: hypothetical protein BGO23_09040 [Solirubrobacterales bacterium 67-14]